MSIEGMVCGSDSMLQHDVPPMGGLIGAVAEEGVHIIAAASL
jgi:hypothetical protein